MDDSQREAVTNITDNIMLIAGAGSGKTVTIIKKIEFLLNNGYKENEILCISLTNETVNNLKRKLNNNIDVLTFHKLAINIINDKNIKIDSTTLSLTIKEYFKLFKHKELTSLYPYDYIYNTIITIIHHMKANNITVKDLLKIYKRTIGIKKIFLKIIMQIYIIYNNELKASKRVDFDDLILLATNQVKDSHMSYKYIIIDEFQDTSKVRLDLILEIIKYSKAKLFVVGDDYQSIYRFSGCNINLFINLNKYLPIKIMYLKYTYRNSQELADIACNFISRNKYQLKKKVISNTHNKKPIKIVYNKSVDEIIMLITSDLLIIGRTNKDIDNINYPNKLTIHKSKGLEATNVLLVNSDNIPLVERDNRLINYIYKTKEHILFEEERRLFYVALTRAKENIYIQVNKKISPFVKELISNYKPYIEIIS